MIRAISIAVLCFTLSACAAVEKAPLSAASLVLQGVKFYFGNSIPSEIPVDSSGTGETREKAIQNALIAAVQEAIGVLIVSDVTVESNRIVRDIAATYSSGVVKSYKVKNCASTDRIQCDISAVVSPFAFRKTLLASGSVTKIDGESLYGQYVTSKNAILQRYRLTEYFFSRIRAQGLQLRLVRFEVQPSTINKVPIYIEYDIRFDPEFKKSIIELLNKLQRDTSGGFNVWNGQWQQLPPGVDPMTIYIEWGPSGFLSNRVWVHTFDRKFLQMMQFYESQEISVMIRELNLCDRVSHNGIFTIDWHRLRRSGIIEVDPDRLRGVKQLSLTAGC